MPIKIRTTYAIMTPESAEYGDYEETGWIDEEGTEYTFSELVDLLRGCEPSASCPYPGMWATDYEIDYDFQTGAEEQHSYHPVTERDNRYFIKACQFAGILK